ncbi:putative U11/U12 small nuclear ribonucleoprotein 25kDa protein [Helianthus debilis subsp. tardiflorus]
MRVLTEDKADSDEYHSNLDAANYKCSFEISGARPSTSSSSPLSPFSPLLLIETLSRKSFSYGKLPLEPIRLTVLKLDGSSFDITVAKNPTVAQLKQGVEDAFNHFPKNGIGKVSWSHVWAQFCLSFNGQKLLNDPDTVAVNGIKDGDQLQFVRHTSISYNLVKERPEKRDHDLQESKMSPSKKEVQTKEGDNDNPNQLKANDRSGAITVNITCQCSWGLLWKRLFSIRTQKRHRTSYVELC